MACLKLVQCELYIQFYRLKFFSNVFQCKEDLLVIKGICNKILFKYAKRPYFDHFPSINHFDFDPFLKFTPTLPISSFLQSWALWPFSLLFYMPLSLKDMILSSFNFYIFYKKKLFISHYKTIILNLGLNLKIWRNVFNFTYARIQQFSDFYLKQISRNKPWKLVVQSKNWKTWNGPLKLRLPIEKKGNQKRNFT